MAEKVWKIMAIDLQNKINLVGKNQLDSVCQVLSNNAENEAPKTKVE